VLVLNNRG